MTGLQLMHDKQQYHSSSETFTAVMFQVDVFWVGTPCSVVVGYQCFWRPCCLWNVGILPHHFTASQPRRPRLGTV